MASTVGSAVTSDTALKQKVGSSTPEVLAQSVANMAPTRPWRCFRCSSSIPPATRYGCRSFALGLVVLLIVGYCAAQFASRINSAGIVYVCGTRGLGRARVMLLAGDLCWATCSPAWRPSPGFEIYGDQFLTGLGLSPGNHAVRAVLYVVGGLRPHAGGHP